MTSLKSITRHYDQLTPHEHFKLSVLAEARGDRAEAERLKETCPRKMYIMDEAGFRERWQAAFVLVSGLASATGVHFGWLAALDTLCEPMGECIRSLMPKGKEPPPVYTPRFFNAGRQAMADHIKTLWEAFAAVCREDLELEPEIVVAAHYPTLLRRFEEYRDLLDTAEIETEHFDRYRGEYAEVWRMATREVEG